MTTHIKSKRQYVIYCDRVKSYFRKATRIGIMYDSEEQAAIYPTEVHARKAINQLQLRNHQIKQL